MNYRSFLKSAHAINLLIFLSISLAFVRNLHAQIEPDYFPMHIGDRWFYKRISGLIHYANKIVEITDTTRFDGKPYFIFEEKDYDIYYEPGKIYYHKHFFRKSETGEVIRYSEFIVERAIGII